MRRISASPNVRSSRGATEVIFLLTLVLFVSAVLMYFGGGLSSVSFAAIWIGQCCLGVQVTRLFLGRRHSTPHIFMLMGPGYLVGFLLSTWMYMLVGGGWFGKTLVFGFFVVAVGTFVSSERRPLEPRGPTASLLVVVFSLVITAMTWEFPELLIAALTIFVVGLFVSIGRMSRHFKVPVVLVGVSCAIYAATLRSEFWFLESDDLANRMAEGTLSVGRGYIGTVGAYPFDRYHWVSPVATALQADLAGVDLLFSFTVASVVASLIMFVSAFGLLLQSVLGQKRLDLPLLLSGTALLLWWKVQIDTEATVGRLAILLSVLSIYRLVQSSHPNWQLTKTTMIAPVAYAVLVGAMLFLYRPDFVVFMLLLTVGLLLSLLVFSPGVRVLVTVFVSTSVIVLGVLLMHRILDYASNSNLSYARLFVDWRPPDLGWCTRGSVLRDALCVFSLEVDLWMSLFVAVLLVGRLKTTQQYFGKIFILVFPAMLSYFAFRLSLTSDFPSSIEGFLQMGLLTGRVFAVLLATYLLLQLKFRIGVCVVASALVFAVVHVSARSYVAEFLDPRQEGMLGRLQGVFTPNLLQWFIVSAVLSVVAVPCSLFLGEVTRDRLLLVVLLGTIGVGLWNLHLTRPMTNDVDSSLIENVIGPRDVFEIGEWLRNNTPEDTVLATNYQCRPTEANRCRSLELVGDGHPRATANWMLMAESRREFLYLSQPFFNPSEFRKLHEVSITPGSHLVPGLTELAARGVDYYVAHRGSSTTAGWLNFIEKSVVRTANFAVIPISQQSSDE